MNVTWHPKVGGWGSRGHELAQLTSPKALVGALGEIVGAAAFDLESEGTAFGKVHGLCYSALGGGSLAERSASFIITGELLCLPLHLVRIVLTI